MDVKVEISDELARFVERKVESGEYGSINDVVENALRVLQLGDEDEPIGETDEQRLRWLRSAYLIGLASGDAGTACFSMRITLPKLPCQCKEYADII